MTDVAAALLKGGPVALLLALGFAIKYASEGISDWRKSRSADSAVVMTDAATTNAMLLGSLESERGENETNRRRIAELEMENASLRDKLYTQRADYEAQLLELRRTLQAATLKLDALQAGLHNTD